MDKSGRRRGGQRRGGSSLPPIVASLCLTKKFRFVASAAASDVTVSAKGIRQLIGMVSGGGGFQYYPYIDAFKIQSVELTAIGAIGTPVTVAMEWAGAANMRSVRSEDTSMGIATAHVRATPPDRSQASLWQSSDTTDALMKLTGPTGTVCDLTLQMTLYDDVVPELTLGVAGTNYAFSILPLDTALASATGKFVPVGYKHVLTN